MISQNLAVAYAPANNESMLDRMASASFAFRDLIECGETWHRLAKNHTPVDNVPLQPDTWTSLSQLASCLLEPLQKHFGTVHLTYGFCSRKLQRIIESGPRPGIAPAHDQHASCELNSKDNLICQRQGAACDFDIIGMEDRMDEVAHWIIDNLAFDALYYYGRNRPLHLSWGPEMRKMTVLMRTNPATGKRSPAGNTKNSKGHALIETCDF